MRGPSKMCWFRCRTSVQFSLACAWILQRWHWSVTHLIWQVCCAVTIRRLWSAPRRKVRAPGSRTWSCLASSYPRSWPRGVTTGRPASEVTSCRASRCRAPPPLTPPPDLTSSTLRSPSSPTSLLLTRPRARLTPAAGPTCRGWTRWVLGLIVSPVSAFTPGEDPVSQTELWRRQCQATAGRSHHRQGLRQQLRVSRWDLRGISRRGVILYCQGTLAPVYVELRDWPQSSILWRWVWMTADWFLTVSVLSRLSSPSPPAWPACRTRRAGPSPSWPPSQCSTSTSRPGSGSRSTLATLLTTLSGSRPRPPVSSTARTRRPTSSTARSSPSPV